jgi:superfamily II DNA or RNA helicase/diadenosine tetraphosphate (Ap4A) HIT family hydrolase
MNSSPFRDIQRYDWIASNRSAFAFFDKFPVSQGHVLVVPFRQISTWWEAEKTEQTDVMELVREVKEILDAEFNPTGYNIGFNSGEDAGQTIDHLHVHVIPRYKGDVEDPRGGIRHVIPRKGNYLQPLLENSGEASSRLLNAESDQRLRKELIRCLENTNFDCIDLVVSFIMTSGLDIILPKLKDAIDRGAKVRILTTDYLDITDPDALSNLLDLSDGLGIDNEQLKVKLWKSIGQSFHPKAYIFHSSRSQESEGFVGSSNLSRSGIDGGIEWNLGTTVVDQLVNSFELLWENQTAIDLTHDLLIDYRNRRIVRLPSQSGDIADIEQEEPRAEVAPTSIQVEALDALEQTRIEGFKAGLVVMATGLGKTWLAAFDTSRPLFKRTLFVAHREEILSQSRDVFRLVRPDADLGLYFGKEKTLGRDVVFASVQTLSRHLDRFDPDIFDYIVIDEFHHASASSYRKIIDHFEPQFLLGLTATPDRMDGADLLALCADNLVFECNLVEGIQRDELVTFRYQGLKDLTDFEPIPWRNGKFDLEELSKAIETSDRAKQSLDAWRAHGVGPTIGFCVSISHARYMGDYFSEAGVRAVAVHSGPDSVPRQGSIASLKTGEIEVVFTVDLFNEGLDVPEIGTVLMLRPTESPVIFLQQLGRGLRKSDATGKAELSVIDFIGNHRSFLNKPRTLLSLGGRSVVTGKDVIDAARSGEFDLPEGCSVNYELEAIDLLDSLVNAKTSMADVLANYCREFYDDYGYRPSAVQVLRASLNLRATKKVHGSWFGFLSDIELLSDHEKEVVERYGEVLVGFENEVATKSFKLVTIKALIDKGKIRHRVSIPDLCMWSLEKIMDDPRLVNEISSEEVGDITEVSDTSWQKYWTKWPLDHLTRKKSGALFAIDGDIFMPAFKVDDFYGETFDAMVSEIMEWRLADYLLRPSVIAGDGSEEIHCRVIHSGGNPIIRINRQKYPNLPSEPTEVEANGETFTFNFVKIAVNVARREGEAGNALHSLLRGWFGPSAGLPGTRHEVAFEETPSGWTLRASEVLPNYGNVVPLFPTYEVACGVAEATDPVQEGAVLPIQPGSGQEVDLGRDFVVFATGESMAGGEYPIHQGDPLLFEWARDVSRSELVGKRVLVQQKVEGQAKSYLKRLERTQNGFELVSDNPSEPSVEASNDMQIIAKLKGVLNQAAVNPMAHLIGEQYTKQQAAELYGAVYAMGPWMMWGHVPGDSEEVLFVTIDKGGMVEEAQYVDRFLSADRLIWSSQNRTTPESKPGQNVLQSPGNGRRVDLWARRDNKDPFFYCGLVLPLSHEGSKPMSVTFRLLTPLSQEMLSALSTPNSEI